MLTKLNENNFTSHLWWALAKEITPCAKAIAREKEMVCCVKGCHVYEDIWAAAIGEVLVCSRELTNVTEIVIVKLYSHKKNLYVFCVRKYFLQHKKRELR